MEYWARDTTQSNFWAHYGVLCQQTDEISRAMAESNMNASNSISRINASMAQCCCNFEEARMRIEEFDEKYKEFPKSCCNCKHKIYGLQKGSCRVFEYCVDTDPFAPSSKCIYNNRKYWSPDRNTARMMGIGYEDSEQDIHDEIECLKDRINQTKYEKFKSELTDVYIKAMDADKPDKKYTVYDLYDLVFPDDPIKAHFDAERKKIEEKYKPQEEIAEKLEAPEVRRTHPEPIPTVTYDDDMMTVIQAAVFWIGAIVSAALLMLI